MAAEFSLALLAKASFTLAQLLGQALYVLDHGLHAIKFWHLTLDHLDVGELLPLGKQKLEEFLMRFSCLNQNLGLNDLDTAVVAIFPVR